MIWGRFTVRTELVTGIEGDTAAVVLLGARAIVLPLLAWQPDVAVHHAAPAPIRAYSFHEPSASK
jgi:hypothetical protein